MYTISGSIKVVADNLTNYNQVLTDLTNNTMASNVVRDDANLTVTFTLNQTVN